MGETSDLFECPACEDTVASADVCSHLCEHEETFGSATLTADTLGADAARRNLVRAAWAHAERRHAGKCFCRFENELPSESERRK
jgi:hypothetical protein